MTSFVILASGESLNTIDFSLIRDSGYPVIACNNSVFKYPDANFLCHADKDWWVQYKFPFKGMRVCRQSSAGAYRFNTDEMPVGLNSGCYAMHFAKSLNARKLILCGFDAGGSHFFGNHPAPIRNPTPHSFEEWQKQFASFNFNGEVVNCSLESNLTLFPKMGLKDALC